MFRFAQHDIFVILNVCEGSLNQRIFYIRFKHSARKHAEVYVWFYAGYAMVGPEDRLGHRFGAERLHSTSGLRLMKLKGIRTSVQAAALLVEITGKYRFPFLQCPCKADAAASKPDFRVLGAPVSFRLEGEIQLTRLSRLKEAESEEIMIIDIALERLSASVFEAVTDPEGILSDKSYLLEIFIGITGIRIKDMSENHGVTPDLYSPAAGIDDVMEPEAVIWTFHLFKHSDTYLQERLPDLGIVKADGSEFFCRAADSVMHQRRIVLEPFLSVVAAFIFYAPEDSRPVETGATIITLPAVRSVKGYLQSIV